MNPQSLGEVEDEILRLSNELERRTDEYAHHIYHEAVCENALKLKSNRYQISAANSNIKAAKAVVDARCHEEAAEYRLAKAVATATKESLLSLRAQLSALQTLARTIGVQS